MRRVIVGGCLLLMAGCAAPKPTSQVIRESLVFSKDQAVDRCDPAKIRSIAKKYIPTITSPTAHQLEAEMAYKAMKSEFTRDVLPFKPLDRRMCWIEIEAEVDSARINAARTRGEFDRR